MLLDILKNEEAALRKMADAASPYIFDNDLTRGTCQGISRCGSVGTRAIIELDLINDLV